ncbi:dihydrodipicolinate synthase [Microstroma glucosiphilum]|uniref:Dihydrodipicolinate synthase n=1 Tax=Pseudomicrostroma glucosiphilum TaxID=1684307 RepID=A0A316U4Z8_9BASI|nr:dihydrodipicolinate synthase [Pseudomicrostroma glucosiphilum]PWN18025.1 dihydrodipicolinate synthase [Pseudomicrostroma glucosiphilum]
MPAQHSAKARLPRAGAYSPTLTFFNQDESIDLHNTVEHALWLARSGLAGLVVMGTNGEAPLVEREERLQILKAIQNALVAEGLTNCDLIVGCGAQSLRSTLLLIEDAKSAGAAAALVLPPSYWAAALSKAAILQFYDDVCASSSLPVMAYNFPAVTGGINLTSDDLLQLAKRNANFVGVKLTCGNVGTAHRVASTLGPERFLTLGGRSESALHMLLGGASGVIAASANLAPKSHVKLCELWKKGDLKDAMDLQTLLSNADTQASKGGIGGLKAHACTIRGLPFEHARVRSPLVTPSAAEVIEDTSALGQLLAYERSL